MMKFNWKIVRRTAGAAVLLLAAGCGKNTVDGCLNSGAERAANGDWEGALKMAKRAVDLQADSVPALVLRALAYERTGERDLAFDSARQAAVLSPESFPAQYTLGRLYASDPTRYTDAMKPLMQAAKLSKFKDVNTLILLANTTVALRSPAAGNWLTFLQRCAPELESNVMFRNLKGIDRANNNRRAEARAEFTAGYKLDKANPLLVLNIGTFFDRYDSNPRLGAQFYNVFLTLASDRPEYAAQRADVEGRLRRAPR